MHPVYHDPAGLGMRSPPGRLHLSESQRAMVAGRVETIGQGARTDLSPIGGMSQSDAAELSNVGKRSILWILTHRTIDFLRLFFWW